jgi:hypothetical protein
MAKQIAGYKQQPTIFNGFRGTPGNIVLSFGDSATQGQVQLNDNAVFGISMQQWEPILEGLLEQVEMDDETGEITALVKEIVDSAQKIIDTEAKRGASDFALSFSTDGTLLLAFDTDSLAEIQKIAAKVSDFANQRAPTEAKALIEDSLKLNYITVEGFNVSSVKVPLVKALEMAARQPAPDDRLNDLMLGAFWAVKDAGGKQVIAVAAGLDFAKTEQAFKSALEQTKTSAPVPKPMGTLSVQGLGKFLQQTVSPIAEKTDVPNLAEAKKVIGILASAGNDATITLNSDTTPDKIEGGYRISGKAIQAIVSAVKMVSEF